jgi:16S rRNA (guanine527-N7)-methyltransferase
MDRLPARFDVSRETHDRLSAYVDLLRRWQDSVNLVGKATLDDVWGRHILDSVQLALYAPEGARRWIDLGSGAGLPGLVLAIYLDSRQPIHVDLVESNGKKAAFLRAAIRQTGAPARVIAKRIEQIESDPEQPAYDVVCARALAPLEKLLGFGQVFIKNGARGLFLKGQHIEEELTAATKYWKIDASRHQSLSDPKGCVLIIERAERV